MNSSGTSVIWMRLIVYLNIGKCLLYLLRTKASFLRCPCSHDYSVFLLHHPAVMWEELSSCLVMYVCAVRGGLAVSHLQPTPRPQFSLPRMQAIACRL